MHPRNASWRSDPVPTAAILDPPRAESGAEDKHRVVGPPPPTTTHAAEELTKIVAAVDLVETKGLIVMGREESMAVTAREMSVIVMGREENAIVVRPEEGTIVMRIGPCVMVIGGRDEAQEQAMMRRGEVLHLDGMTAIAMTSPTVNAAGTRAERQHASNSHLPWKGCFLAGSSWRNLTAFDMMARCLERPCFAKKGVKV